MKPANPWRKRWAGVVVGLEAKPARQARWIAPGLVTALQRLALGAICAGGLAFAAGQTPENPAADPPVLPTSNEPITPLPLTVDLDPAKVRLGERLFHEVRLSRTHSLACATCHRLTAGGADGQPRSLGSDGNPLDYNTPTVFNVALNFRFNWRGAFRTLEAQTAALLLNPRVMATDWPELLATLRDDPGYREAFAASYPAGLEPAAVLDALVTFERSLLTPNARFDQYLRGRPEALTAEEQRGYQRFKSHGCVACHQGANVGGNLFQQLGIFQNYSGHGAGATAAAPGRATLPGDARDRWVFRVPSLRNVAVTAPYFHDGGVPTLERAVAVMARIQLGRTLPDAELDLIVRFLRTLTGEYQGRPLAADPAP